MSRPFVRLGGMGKAPLHLLEDVRELLIVRGDVAMVGRAVMNACVLVVGLAVDSGMVSVVEADEVLRVVGGGGGGGGVAVVVESVESMISTGGGVVVAATASAAAEVVDGVGAPFLRRAGSVILPDNRPNSSTTQAVFPLGSGMQTVFTGQQNPFPHSTGAMMAHLSLCLLKAAKPSDRAENVGVMVKASCHAMRVYSLGSEGPRRKASGWNSK